MALSITPVRRTAIGAERLSVADVNFDASYPTGGESLSASDLGLTAFLVVSIEQDGDGFVVKFDRTNSKLMIFQGDNDGVADGPLVELPNTTDASAITVRVAAIG